MIYAQLIIIIATLVFSAVCFYTLSSKLHILERMCEKNMEFIARHAAEHVRMSEEQEEAAGRIAVEIEKRWDTSLQKMLDWNPFVGNEEDG